MVLRRRIGQTGFHGYGVHHSSTSGGQRAAGKRGAARGLVEGNFVSDAGPEASRGEWALTLKSQLRSVAARGFRLLDNHRHQQGKFVSDHDRGRLRVPADLSVAQAERSAALVIGECVATWLGEGAAHIDWSHDFLLINNYSVLPSAPPRPPAEYGFQLVQLPLRSLLPEWEYLALRFDEVDAWERLLDNARERLSEVFESAMRYNIESGLLTFVAGFLVPQQNPMGRMLPRNDPRNLVFFVESLNRHLVALAASRQNSYYVDLDQIASGLGKQFIQDDSITSSSHGAFLSDWSVTSDRERLEPLEPVSTQFDIRVDQFRQAVWIELMAMYRTVRALDQVKLIIVDLDDTLWRGIVADEGDVADEIIEGWPMGLIEALQFLKKRGVLLAICSKNDESKIVKRWASILGGRIRLDDFVVRKINWRPKADNVEEILDEVNLLSRNVVFVDDNPREREEIRSAFPEIRVLGAQPYQLKRVLLWSSETQVAFVSGESSRRTQMVQGQISRERERKKVSREDFLSGLGLEARILEIRPDDLSRASRAIELLNKTNQFNTTSKRWTVEEFQALSCGEREMVGFTVRDKFTDYGMVGVIVLHRGAACMRVEQVVMSCRVFGLDVELAVLAAILQRSGQRSVEGLLQKTSTNQPCWGLFPSLGFVEVGDGHWSVDGQFDSDLQFSVSVLWERSVRP
jgi:FkbH-like protein